VRDGRRRDGVAPLLTYPSLPVVGINLGTVGFLTAGDAREIARLLDLLLEGHCIVEERLVLQTRFREQTYLAVNEMVIKGRPK